jgi:ABC-type dipeptide/oligopeptide/nickel transport system permease subunit
MAFPKTKKATPGRHFRTVEGVRQPRRGRWRRTFLALLLTSYVLAALLPVADELFDGRWDPNESHAASCRLPEIHGTNAETECLDCGRWAPPSGDHPLGTDNNRKDVLCRLAYGARTSVMMGLIATSVFLLTGVFFGVVSGYGSGWSRILIQGLFHVGQTFPILLLLLLSVIFIDAIFSGRAGNWGIAILMALFGFFSSPKLSEMVRGRILTLRDRTYLEAATALGLSHAAIIWRHILRSECRPIILVQGAYMMGQAVLVETTLTYLNFGVEYPLVSWGLMLREMQDGIINGGLAIRSTPRKILEWVQGSMPEHVFDRWIDSFTQNLHVQPLYPILTIALTVLVFVELARYLSDHFNVED